MSYPLTPDGFTAAQLFFAVHHLGLVVLLVALAVAGPTGAVGRAGAWVSAAGMLALSATEVLAVGSRGLSEEEAFAGALGVAYGASTSLVGLGALVLGVAVLRPGPAAPARWTGWRRWAPLGVGVWEVAVLTPGIMAGFVAGRLAIGSWMLVFAALGWALRAEARGPR